MTNSVSRKNKEDYVQCDGCGIFEHITLLDGKPDARGEHSALLCIRCYGPGWSNADGDDDFALSAASELAPLYAAWRKANP